MTKFIIEQHNDGFVAYPLGVQGVMVGQGDTREEALEDARSALEFHIETFDITREEFLAAYEEV
jgi:predicted RNase H-like HicB family nuclease